MNVSDETLGLTYVYAKHSPDITQWFVQALLLGGYLMKKKCVRSIIRIQKKKKQWQQNKTT